MTIMSPRDQVTQHLEALGWKKTNETTSSEFNSLFELWVHDESQDKMLVCYDALNLFLDPVIYRQVDIITI